ncbi:MAG TPA: hypothetical protein VFG10_02240 [Saprospiraceae bacterium]|nr:hypothetical protein [Saprospiraceae bacterium]
MKNIQPAILIFCFMQLAIFCMCKNDTEKKADNPSAPTVVNTNTSMQNSSLNKEFFMNAIGNLKSGEVLDSVTLKNILAQKIVDLTRTSLLSKKSEQGGAMVGTSEATYKGENKTLYIKIIDAGGNAGYIRSQAPWSGMQFQNTRDDGYEKSIVVDGNKIKEAFNSGTKQANLTVIYNDRILVNLFGPNVTMEELYMAIK